MRTYAYLVVFGLPSLAVLYLLLSAAFGLRDCYHARSQGICACGKHIHRADRFEGVHRPAR